MNNEEKAKEISYHYLQQVDFYKKTKYDEDDIISTARDTTLEMAAWKEQQIIEKAVKWLKPIFKDLAGYDYGGDLVEDFKKAMKGINYDTRRII